MALLWHPLAVGLALSAWPFLVPSWNAIPTGTLRNPDVPALRVLLPPVVLEEEVPGSAGPRYNWLAECADGTCAAHGAEFCALRKAGTLFGNWALVRTATARRQPCTQRGPVGLFKSV